MDASSFALQISWLKFEPMVSNFPVIETATTVSITNATWKVGCIFIFYADKRLCNGINKKTYNRYYKAKSISYTYSNKHTSIRKDFA